MGLTLKNVNLILNQNNPATIDAPEFAREKISVTIPSTRKTTVSNAVLAALRATCSQMTPTQLGVPPEDDTPVGHYDLPDFVAEDALPPELRHRNATVALQALSDVYRFGSDCTLEAVSMELWVQISGLPRQIMTTDLQAGVEAVWAIRYPWYGGDPSFPLEPTTLSRNSSGILAQRLDTRPDRILHFWPADPINRVRLPEPLAQIEALWALAKVRLTTSGGNKSHPPGWVGLLVDIFPDSDQPADHVEVCSSNTTPGTGDWQNLRAGPAIT